MVVIEYEGHGGLDGPRGLVTRGDTLPDDVPHYIAHVARSRSPSQEEFALCFRRGGAAAHDHVSRPRAEYEGAIPVAPWLRSAVAPPASVVDRVCQVVGAPGSVGPWSCVPLAPAGGDFSDHRFQDQVQMSLALSAPTLDEATRGRTARGTRAPSHTDSTTRGPSRITTRGREKALL